MSDLLLSRQPRSILVLPPLDRTAEASATYGAYSSVTFPLAESGYYVFPVAPVNAALRRHGLRTPVEIHRAPLSKLVEIFDPDAVLYLTVTHLGMNYAVLNTSTKISMTGRLVDADTGALLWRGKETFEQNTNTGYGDLSLMLSEALASRSASINSDISRSLAQSANRKLLRGRQNGWILGPYHPEVEKDLNEAELARGARPAYGYGYGGAEPAAVAAYQRGWAYILDEGRWEASEEAFREAARLDPDWAMGKAQVARITLDPLERARLLLEIEAGYAAAPEDSRLLLEVFLMNIRASLARDRGERMPEGFAASRMATAVQNFTRFGERHPGETYIQAERVEWLHAAEGAAAGLALMDELPARVLAAPFYAGYEARLQAEQGNMAAAWEAFARFEAMVDVDAPAVPYVRAQLLEAEGDKAGARAAAKRAADLDPKHQLAVRLRNRLAAGGQ